MVFSCSWHFLGSPPLFPFFYRQSYYQYPVGSPLFLQFSVAGAGAGFFLLAEFMSGCKWSRLLSVLATWVWA